MLLPNLSRGAEIALPWEFFPLAAGRLLSQRMRHGRSLPFLLAACMHTRVASLLMPATAPKWRGAFRKSFQANGGLLYKTNFLEPSTYEDVRKECRSLRKHFKRELDSVATGRLGCCLDSRSQAYLNLMTDDISTVRDQTYCSCTQSHGINPTLRPKPSLWPTCIRPSDSYPHLGRKGAVGRDGRRPLPVGLPGGVSAVHA